MMRMSLRVTAVVGVLIVFLILVRPHKHLPAVLPGSENSSDSDDAWPSQEDKIVVLPKMTGEDTDWPSPDLPE